MTKPSFLERAARAIEPARTDSAPKSIARRIKPLHEIAETNKGLRDMLEDAPINGAKPTNGHVTMLDQSQRLFFTDGSLRHPGGKVNGRLTRKARAKVKRRGVR